ncbi:MAG: permease prefix domain 2-containing transporter [Pyrinomonadaceae bacterium]
MKDNAHSRYHQVDELRKRRSEIIEKCSALKLDLFLSDEGTGEKSNINILAKTSVPLIRATLMGWYLHHLLEQIEQPSAPIPQPPLNAEFLLHLLLRHDEHDAIIGDLIERYGKKCARLGTRRANFWFCAEVFWTAQPLIKRALFKVSGLMTLAEFVRRHIS